MISSRVSDQTDLEFPTGLGVVAADEERWVGRRAAEMGGDERRGGGEVSPVF